MLETSATNVIAAAIGRSLDGSGEVTVCGDGFRIMPNKAAVASCIGMSGRVFRAVFDGWGTAFEKRRIAVQILVDLNWCVDEMVLSVLKQTELTLRQQMQQGVRAAAAGIPSPLDLEAFTDPRAWGQNPTRRCSFKGVSDLIGDLLAPDLDFGLIYHPRNLRMQLGSETTRRSPPHT